MFQLRTLVDIFARVVSGDRERALLWLNAAGEWAPITSRQLASRVYLLSMQFEQWGIGKGDRVALLSENRWEWPVADFATLLAGAADVPVYPTLTADQTAALLVDCGARTAVVSSEAQYRKLASIRERTRLERIVIMDDFPAPDAVSLRSILAPSLENGGAAEPPAGWDRWMRRHGVEPEDLATLVYTSGTTGEPKGVMLTHGNLASNLNYSTAGYSWEDKELCCVSFLPLSHITARHLDYALFCYGATLAYCGSFQLLPGALKAVKPNVFVAVPRVYEKVREEAERRAALRPVTRKLFAWALAAGRRQRARTLKGQRPTALSWRLADWLVFRKIRAGFGGRVEDFVAGGAPLGMDTAGWFADAGIRIFEGYGLSETSPVLSLNTPRDHRIGSVGKPIESVQHRLEPDGELLVRGPFLFQSYWGRPEATAEAIDSEGWFHTGDIARIDDDGFLYITGRKKDLIKTSGGKAVAPQMIETRLCAETLVSHAAVAGDRRQYLCAVIAPNFPALEDWASRQSIPFRSREELVELPEVHAAFQEIVRRLNAGLANFETVKRFIVVAEEWTVESGELTPSMKLRRNIVLQRHEARIAALYPEARRLENSQPAGGRPGL
jgi:long-chain acyl-CoA synthetase